MKIHRVLAAAFVLVQSAIAADSPAKPLKVFILAGQSNMQGQGIVTGYELAGFVWWHGWNDFCSPKVGTPEYEANLTNLIKDVRRELGVPKLPVVIGEFTGPWGADCKEAAALTIRKAQKAVAEKPEFAGTVTFVVTHDFVRTKEESPTGEAHHEFKNGETYFLIGDALGKGMLKLLPK